MEGIKKNIVLVEDHEIIRHGLKELIEKLGPFKISGQFETGTALLASLPLYPEPDLILLDINMPGMNGDELMERLNEKGVKIKVLVLTIIDKEDTIIKLFRLGVRGYLLKNCKAEELKNALNEIFLNGYYHNEFLENSLGKYLNVNKKSEEEIIIEQLSVREREFLKLVCHEKEYKYQIIAELMKVHPRTVDGYRDSIFLKFGIKSKTGLVLFVMRHKLLEHL